MFLFHYIDIRQNIANIIPRSKVFGFTIYIYIAKFRVRILGLLNAFRCTGKSHANTNIQGK